MEALKAFPVLLIGFIVLILMIFTFGNASETGQNYKENLVIIDSFFVLFLIINIPLGLFKVMTLLKFS